VKILITRTDRLGDLVLALPVVDLLHRIRPDWALHLLIAPGLEAVTAAQQGIAGVHTWRDDWPQDKLQSLVAALAAERFDAVLMLQYRRELALMLRRAGIGPLWGPRSRISSWFLLRHGRRQGRSRSGRHEMDLNLELGCALAGLSGQETPRAMADVRHPRLQLDPAQAAWGRNWRDEEAAGAERVAFIHPGSGGSALDWGPERFAAVANQLSSRKGTRVFMTGAAADAHLVRAAAEHLDRKVGVLLERFTLGQFMSVLAAGDLLVAPSTGPLHLAAALGAATIGLFPPAPVMSSLRWGQRGPLAVQVSPEVVCPQKRVCVREKCPLFNCLEQISPAAVAERAASLLDELDREPRT